MKKIFLSLVVLILFFQIISAVDTQIDIKTVPLKNVNLVVSTNEPPYIANKDSNEYGDVSFVFPSDYAKYDLTIFVKDVIENKKVAFENLENQIAGEDIYLEAVPSGFEIIETPSEEETIIEKNETIVENSKNETEEEILNEFFGTEEQQEKEKSKILGWVVFGEDSTLKNVLIWVGVIIVLILIFIFAFRKFRKKENKIKVKKLSDWMEEKKNDSDTKEDYTKAIEEAQRKIEEAQRQINTLKNQDRIKQAEEKLKKDQQELKDLRGF